MREETALIYIAVSEDVRVELQDQIEEERRRNEQDIAAGVAYFEAERQAEERARLVNRSKRHVLEAIHTALGYLKRLLQAGVSRLKRLVGR